uniref:Uncharacterized protein n=1 Tax=Arundo donax TaxID=35708 RepID=A0A0A9ETW4_ARUDO
MVEVVSSSMRRRMKHERPQRRLRQGNMDTRRTSQILILMRKEGCVKQEVTWQHKLLPMLKLLLLWLQTRLLIMLTSKYLELRLLPCFPYLLHLTNKTMRPQLVHFRLR